MTDPQIVTISETATFTLTPELLQQIGVGAGDQIEIALSDRLLTVRPVTEPDDEATRLEKMMDSIMDRHDNVFRRLAEGPQ